jgi:hypothetical protein
MVLALFPSDTQYRGILEMAKTNKELIDRLAVALGLALDEIHNPGAARAAGFDIDAMIRGVIKEAVRQGGIPEMVRDEIKRRTA